MKRWSWVLLGLLLVASVAAAKGDVTATVDSTFANAGLHLTKWDTSLDLGLNVSAVPVGNRNMTSFGNETTFSIPNIDLNLYPVKDAYEFEIILKNKPAKNSFCFPINTTNLDFFYQGRLSDDVALGERGVVGCNDTDCWRNDSRVIYHRDPMVVGSYAVYHSSLRNNEYGTGKAYHILRPNLTDAKGAMAWANLSIDKDSLCVAVPQNYLDNAVYPVTLDPTFGQTTIGGSWTVEFTGGGGAENFAAYLGNMSYYGLMSTETWGLYAVSAGTIRSGLYTGNITSPITKVKNDTNTFSISDTTSPGSWFTTTDNYNVNLIAGTMYWAALGDASQDTYIGWDSVAGYTAYFNASTTHFPATWTDYTSAQVNTKRFSVYLNYSVANITFVNNASVNIATTHTIVNTSAFNVAAGNLIVVGSWGGTISTITDDAIPANVFQRAGVASGNMEIWYAYNTVAKTGDVLRVTVSSNSYQNVIALQYSGADRTAAVLDSAFAPASNSDSTSPFISRPNATLESGEVIVGFAMDTIGGQTYSSYAAGNTTWRTTTVGTDFAAGDHITIVQGTLGFGLNGTVNEANTIYTKAFRKQILISSLTWNSNSTNSTTAGTNVLHSVDWDATVNTLSGYIFSFCNGNYTNVTTTSYQTAWKSPTLNSTLAGGGFQPTQDAFAGDVVYANATIGNGTNYTGYTFDVPSDATILGISVLVEGLSNQSSGTQIIKVNLNNGSAWGTENNTADISTTRVNRTQGSPTSLWGLAWTPSNINSLMVNVTSGSTATTVRMALDWIAVNVTYSNTSTTYPPCNVSWMTYTNDTWTAMTGVGNWSNVTKLVNSTVGAPISWYVTANDTANNQNTTAIFNYTTTSGVTACSPWLIDCATISSISNATDAMGCGVSFTGTGIVALSGNITNYTIASISTGCEVVITGAGRI